MEFACLVQNEAVREEYEDNFSDWGKAIIHYSKTTQLRNTALQSITEMYSDDTDESKSTCT